MTTDLFHAWRLAMVALGGFNVGFALYVGMRYLKGDLHSGIYRGGRHVYAMMTSYVLLTAFAIGEFNGRIQRDVALSWRLSVATVAFSLGTWALYQLMKYRSKTPLGKEN